MARLCVVLAAPTLQENEKLLASSSPDMAELRVDRLEDPSPGEIARFPSRTGLPVILTCRKEKDGGDWKGTDAERESLLLRCLEGSFDFIDLEEEETSRALSDKAAARGCRVIRSLHDFQGVPGDLEERLSRMARRGDLVKAAVMPQGIGDVTRLFRIGTHWKGENLILLGMGDYGVPTRILASRMNSSLTFCSPAAQEAAAPGHISLETLLDVYRIGKVEGDTALYGIIGRPVLHSRSPHIHNRWLEQTGQKGIYIPFPVDNVPEFFDLACLLDLRGFSVTVPHKQAVMPLLEDMSAGVRKIGACNTVVRRENGWHGYNTDAAGFLNPLKKEKGPLKGLRAAVIGAGGAARSAVYALAEEGCDTVVYNRTPSRARELAAEMGCGSGSLEDFHRTPPGHFDLIIQTTSAGMEGHPGPDNPIGAYAFQGREFLYDIIYTPPETPLMRKARDAGCAVLGGWPMLTEQARQQFRLFTGQEAPREASLQ